MKKEYLIILSWLLVIIWLCVIFFFSNMNADNSTKVSKGLVSNTIKTTTDIGSKIGVIKDKPTEEEIDTISSNIHGIIRKVAHFTEFLILALLVFNALKISGAPYTYIITIILCILCASFDEAHQLFIDGRAGRLLDVLIDSSGASLGTFICYLIILHNSTK